jgi:glycosyltransferase involved in cell wall biosynthesis
VVVPAFNNAEHIEEAVESVLAQTFEDFELLISDHSSTDGTWERLQRFRSDVRVRLQRIPRGGGAPQNWNFVTSLASGEMVKLLCGDDLLAPDCLALEVEAIDGAGEGVVMTAARRDIVDTMGRIVLSGRGLRGLDGRIAGAEAIRSSMRAGTNIFGEPCCVLMRTEALAAVGGWDGSRGYVIDWATYVRVLHRGDLVAIPKSVAAFRMSRNQWSRVLRSEQTAQVEQLRHRVLGDHPEWFKFGDRAVGKVMTHVRTLQRRVAYVLLRRRL